MDQPPLTMTLDTVLLIGALAVAHRYGFIPRDDAYKQATAITPQYGEPDPEWWNFAALYVRRFETEDARDICGAWQRAIRDWSSLTDSAVLSCLTPPARNAVKAMHDSQGKSTVENLLKFALRGSLNGCLRGRRTIRTYR